MKTFATTFEWDGVLHAGPLIHAENFEQAKLIAEYHGLLIDGELEAIIGSEIGLESKTNKRVIH